EVTPLMIDNTVYICTPHDKVIALDAVTGKPKWVFDAHLKEPMKQTMQHLTCRGVSYYGGSAAGNVPTASQDLQGGEDKRLAESDAEVTTQNAGVPQNIVTGKAKPGDPNPVVDHKEPAPTAAAIDPNCVKRLFAPTSDGRLIALSAATGLICPGFGGDDGTINLWANMPNVNTGSIYSTSPPLVTDHLVV